MGEENSQRPILPVDAQWARTKSFTRRSRALPDSLERTFQREGDKFVIEVARGAGWTTVAEEFAFSPAAAFGREAPLVVEIGCGTGDQIVAAAAARPDENFLALEVWQPGIAKLVSRAAEAGVDNLRVIEADAAQALPIILEDGAAHEVWTFFPDPWRKARHRKRRLVSPAFAEQITRILAEGGLWRLATDWDDYAWQMRDVIEAAGSLENPYAGENPDPEDPEPTRGGFAPRFQGRIQTRFETRGLEAGRRIHDLVAVRLPEASAD